LFQNPLTPDPRPRGGEGGPHPALSSAGAGRGPTFCRSWGEGVVLDNYIHCELLTQDTRFACISAIFSPTQSPQPAGLREITWPALPRSRLERVWPWRERADVLSVDGVNNCASVPDFPTGRNFASAAGRLYTRHRGLPASPSLRVATICRENVNQAALSATNWGKIRRTP